MPFSVVGLPDICGMYKEIRSPKFCILYHHGFHCQDILNMFHWRVMSMAGEDLIFYGFVFVAL
jgi:hypothetical protein